MNLLKTLTKKNLLLNKKRTIVTIIGIMLSVALITAVSSMYASGLKSLIEYEKKVNGNFHIAYNDVDSKDLNLFEQNRAIDKIYKVKRLGYAKIESKNEYKPYAYVMGMDKDSMKNLSLNLVSGRLPNNSNEIVITTHLKTNGRVMYDIGDEVELNIGERYKDNEEINRYSSYIEGEILKNTNTKKYKIVGIIERPSKNIESYDNPGYSFVTYIDSKDMIDNIDLYVRYTKEGLKNYVQVTSDLLGINKDSLDIMFGNKLANNNEEFSKANEEYQNSKYQIDANIYLLNFEQNPIKNNAVGDLYKIIIVVCLIIVFTSVFCIKNSFDISITEKIKQYGMLRSVGATKKQIRKNVFYEATILGVIGIILGIVLGLIATYILIIISNKLLINSIDTVILQLMFDINIYAILVSVLLGIVTIYLSAIRSAHKASKVSPIESIRNSGDIKIKRNKVKSPKIVNKIFGIGGEISYKNLKRNKKKYRTTIISLIVSTSIFISLSYFMTLAMESVKDEINSKDYNISLRCNDSKECETKAIQTTNFDYIDRYAILKYNVIKLTEHKVNKEVEEKFVATYSYPDENGKEINYSQYDDLNVLSLGDKEYRNYIKQLNLKYDDCKDKGILLDSFVMTEYTNSNKKIKNKYKVYNYQNGNTINFKYYTKTSEENSSIEVIKTTDIIPFGYKDQISEPNLSSVLILSDSKYNELFKDDSIQKIVYDSNNPDKLQDDIDKYLDSYDIDLKNINESVKKVKNMITLIGIFLYGFITVITLIGVTNIFNTITTSVYLRRREFAMLKSVGMTTKEFNKMIRLESLFMGIKSLMFSIPIGILLSYLVFMSLGKEMGTSYEFPIVSIIISIIVVFILIAFIMKYSVGKVNKQNIIETIRNENI